MSDFSDRPFVAGSLVGLRAFSVDSLGRLVGPSFGGVFKPGENVAECRPTHMQRAFRQLRVAMTYSVGGKEYPATAKVANESEPESPHVVGNADCSCGYYAYFDGTNGYAEPVRVEAVIEGYGVCTVGDRGFRAGKARLLALIYPEAPRTHPAWFDKLADWTRRHDSITALIGVLTAMLSLASGIAGIAAAIEGHPAYSFPLSIFALLTAPVGPVLFKADMHGIDRAYPRVSGARCADADPQVNRDLVARNYPDVPVFRSMKEALDAFPLTQPEPPAPTDEDFWTRSAS